jgi:hypothetical protein
LPLVFHKIKGSEEIHMFSYRERQKEDAEENLGEKDTQDICPAKGSRFL